MKNSKKIIIVTLIIAVILALVTGSITYTITVNNRAENGQGNSTGSKKDDTAVSLVVGEYSLQYGTYTGCNIEYYWDDEREEMVEGSRDELTLRLNSDNTYELSGEKHKFTIVGSSIVVPDFDNVEIFEAAGNNKIRLLIGAGVELTLSSEQ